MACDIERFALAHARSNRVSSSRAFSKITYAPSHFVMPASAPKLISTTVFSWGFRVFGSRFYGLGFGEGVSIVVKSHGECNGVFRVYSR